MKFSTSDVVSIVLIVVLLFSIGSDYRTGKYLDRLDEKTTVLEKKRAETQHICDELKKGNIFEPLSPMSEEMKNER